MLAQAAAYPTKTRPITRPTSAVVAAGDALLKLTHFFAAFMVAVLHTVIGRLLRCEGLDRKDVRVAPCKQCDARYGARER